MTLEEIKDYLRIADNYEDNFINELVETSKIYIDSMVGEAYKADDKAVKLSALLQKKLIIDMYENRSTEIPQNTKQDRIVTSILEKLSNYTEVV
ncbi:phage gp6-like head-tail connector protein [Clostridium sp. P21]|uniref:Phage gp6-like head-tail connector protein n=1 Tax=Clostridium muellerianum TaxID=2716538 RepID=A0A7Y0HR64_9CLOT|nr:phage gp6-like head-tail connector protein [Clostridium muellerianum]